MTRKMLLNVFIFVLLTVFTLLTAIGQEALVPKTVNDLKKQLATEMEKQHIAGMMLTIVNKDSVLYAGGLGYADVEKKTPVTENHLFRQASITKMFTALAILNLVKEGKLTVNTRLKDIAPEIPFKNKWEKTNPITIAQLLEHTTAFSDKSPFEEYNFSDRQINNLDAVKIFEKFMISKWPPGERHSYSGVNYAILAYIIERVSKKSFGDFLREKVFSPLGMPAANVKLAGDNSGTYCKGYVWKNNHFQFVPHQPQYNPGYGSLNANVADYAHALQSYLHDWQTPAGQFLSKTILEDSESPHTYFSARLGLKNTYAYGNDGLELNGRIFRGHRGAIGGYLSEFLYNRNLGLGYAFSINTHNEAFFQYTENLIQNFVTRNLPKVALPPDNAVNKNILKTYSGYYRYSNPAQLYSGFFESLQNTFKLQPTADEVAVQLLPGGSMVWKAADLSGFLYRNSYATHPHILFLKSSNNELAITDNTMYFRKITAFEAWIPIILLLSCTIILLSSLPFGFINLAFLLFRKIPKSQLILRLSPAFSTLGLMIILWVIPQLFDHMKECTPMNTSLLIWTSGRYIFAFFSICTMVLLLIRWKSINSNPLKIYLLFTAVAGCYLCGQLAINHWFS